VPFPQFNFYADRILLSPNAGVQRPEVKLQNVGGLRIQPNGILMGSYIDFSFTPVAVSQPTYLRGHTQSKEFHRVGCQFGDLIKANRLRRFISPRAAINAGYNGCATCYAEFETQERANLYVGFDAGGQPPNRHQTINVTYQMSLVQATGTQGDQNPQSHTEARRNWVPPDGIYHAGHPFRGLVPGIWQVTVSAEGWNATCKRRLYADRTREIRFTLGAAGCANP
jgi:hypothetical protein